MDRRNSKVSVKRISNGYLIDFTINGERYRERIIAPHYKTAEKRINEQETIYKMAITISDQGSLEKYPNSGIIQKAFVGAESKFTINEYFNIWFGRHKSSWSHTTIRGYTQKYMTHILPNFGNIRLVDFTASSYHDWAKHQSMSGKSMNEIRNILSQIFKEAFINEVINLKPMKRTRPAKIIQKEPEPFTEVEIDKILDTLESPYREYFNIAFYTGMRTGELIALRWEDIDINRNKIHVRKSISHGIEKAPKTKGSIRSIDMSKEAKSAFLLLKENHLNDVYRVFINPKTNSTYKNAEGIRKYI
jgi:integrase